MRSRLAALVIVSLTISVLRPPLAVAQDAQTSSNPDVLDSQIQTAFKQKEYRYLVELIQQRHALGGHFPAPFWYAEAVAYYHLGQKSAALSSLDNYFAQADHGKYPYNESVALAAEIRNEMYHQSDAESNFHWAGTVKGTAGRVVVADVNLNGQLVREEGFTVSCDYQALPAEPVSVTFDSSDEPTAVEQGIAAARSGFWQPVRAVFTVHFPVQGMPAELSSYSLPPWFGSYDFATQKWSRVALNGHMLALPGYSQEQTEVASGQYESSNVFADIGYDTTLSLDDFSLIQRLSWNLSGDLCRDGSPWGLCQGLVVGLLRPIAASISTGLGIESMADTITPYTSGAATAKSSCQVIAYRQPPAS